MLRHLSAAALGLAAFLLCASFAVAQSCLSTAALRATLSQNISGVELREMNEAAAQSFIIAFNAVPPRSDVAADAVMLARHREAPQAVVMFFWRDCMTGRAVLPTDVLDTLLASIETEA